MKFQLSKDALVETISDDMKLTDVINAKVNSIGREVINSLCLHLHLNRPTLLSCIPEIRSRSLLLSVAAEAGIRGIMAHIHDSLKQP